MVVKLFPNSDGLRPLRLSPRSLCPLIMSRSTVLARCASLVSIALLVACGGGGDAGGGGVTDPAPVAPPPPQPLTSIILAAPDSTVRLGDALTVTATVRDALGRVVADPTLTWESASPTHLSLSAGPGGSATVRATRPGPVAVSARFEGKSASITVSAYRPGFVSRRDTRFILDGEPFSFGGTNNFYLQYGSAREVDDLLDRAVSMGLGVIRMWAFIDIGALDGTRAAINSEPVGWGRYLHYWDAATGHPAVNEVNLRKIDYALAAARTRGLRLTLVLTNNWVDFGGMDQYAAWYGLQYHDQFYTDPRTREAYRSYAAALIGRTNTVTGVLYRYDPTIFAWELANEPRCHNGGAAVGGLPQSSSCTASTIVTWAREMSDWIRSLDASHMISVGDEGFLVGHEPYYPADGVDHEALTRLPNIDFGTVHLYLGGVYSADWGTNYIREHGRAAIAFGKPVILEEFGYHDAPERPAVYRAWTDAALSSGFAGWNFWWLAGRLDSGELHPDHDKYTLHGTDPAADVLRTAAQRMRDRE